MSRVRCRPKENSLRQQSCLSCTVCVAVDCGSDVINRKAARASGRNAAGRNAIVIDRFFDTKQKALAWAKVPAHFMTVQILTSGTKQSTRLVATEKSKVVVENC
jgi:hypothetical protein